MIFARKAAKVTSVAALSFGLVLALGCGETYRPIANPITQPGGDPQLHDAVAVINSNPAALAPGSATFINVAGDVNTGNQTAGLGASYASYDKGYSALFIPNPGSDSITYVTESFGSTVTTNFATITVTAGSKPTAMFPGTGQMFALNSGSDAICPASKSVGIIDASTNTLSSEVCVGQSPSWAVQAATQNLLFVADSQDNAVYVIDPTIPALKTTIPVGTAPSWVQLSLDGSYVFVLNKGSNNISVIDVNAVFYGTLSLPVPSFPTGGTGPVSGYEDTKLNRLYVLNQGSATLSAFDISNPLALVSLHAPVAVGAQATVVSGVADGTRIYVANSGANTITEVQGGSFLTKTIAVSSDPTVRVTSVGVSKDGSKLYITSVTTNDKGNMTTIIRTSDDVIVNTIAAPRQDVNTCEITTTTCTTLLQRPMQVVGAR